MKHVISCNECGAVVFNLDLSTFVYPDFALDQAPSSNLTLQDREPQAGDNW